MSNINYNGNNHSYTYDANGNMTSGPDFSNPLQTNSRSITYNADNMPTVITHSIGGTTNVTYDGGGVRAKKSVQGGGTTYYVGENYEVISGASTKYIFAGNLRIAKKTASSTHYFHKDHLGSSSVMTDAAGLAVETTEYMPYGGTRKHTGTGLSNYKFTDQEHDPESGLYNYDARLYDPMIGRFISADTIVPRPFDPQSLNRYSYARNNPLIYVDPSGHEDGDLDDTGGGWGIDSDSDMEDQGTTDVAGSGGGWGGEGSFGGSGPDNPASPKQPIVQANTLTIVRELPKLVRAIGAGIIASYVACKKAMESLLNSWNENTEDEDKSKQKERSPYPPGKRNKSKSKKDAYEKAKKEGNDKKPIHHPHDPRGPHYHPNVPMPKPDQVTPKRPSPHDHYYYPKNKT